ncbi:PulF Type II secretory pathway, component PulF [Comamonadaceae bacterium]
MATFRVRHLQPGDAKVSETDWVADSVASVRQEFQGRGHAILSISAVKVQGSAEIAFWRREPAPDFALFCREVRTLLVAGMTVVEAVETLSARERLRGQHHSLSARLLKELQQGRSLSDAIAALPQAPSVLVAAVRAGERTSNLAQALEEYLGFEQLVSQLRKKVISAAIYPGLVSAIGLGITIFLLLVVMPNFANMYENLRGSAQGSLAITIWLSQWMGQHRIIMFSALVLVLAGLSLWLLSGYAKRHVLQLAHQIPWLHARISDFELAMVYQALALLLRGGYPMDASLKIARQSAMSQDVAIRLDSVLDTVEQGGLVSGGLSQAGLCDEVDRRLMAAAERNGNFYFAAQVVSQLHRERFELFVERVTRIVEPVLLLLVALGVGGLVVMMYLPVFDMATQLQ